MVSSDLPFKNCLLKRHSVHSLSSKVFPDVENYVKSLASKDSGLETDVPLECFDS